MRLKIGKKVKHLAITKKNVNRDKEMLRIKKNAGIFLKVNSRKMKKTGCPACSSGNHFAWAKIFGFHYSKCGNCGLIFLNPIPSQAALIDYYTDGKYSSGRNQTAPFDKRITSVKMKDVMLPRYRFVSQFKKIKSWIDLGTGNGEMVYALKNLVKPKIDVFGVEPGLDRIEYAKKYFGLELIHADVLEFLKNNHLNFDVVSLFGLLEHLAEPKRIIKTLEQKMKKGALLALLVPVGESVASYLQKADNQLIARHLMPPSHVTLWSQKSMELILKKHGFEIKGVWKYGQDCFELYYLLANQLDEKEKNHLLDKMEIIQKAFDRADLSDEMLVVAQKI